MNIHVDWNLLLNLASILVAVVSYAKMRSAREAERIARKKLLIQRATEEFEEMARGAARLSMSVRSQDWHHGAELGTALRISLARANGSWPDLLKGLEKDKLEVAGKGIQSLTTRIPAQGAIDGELLQQMIEQCNLVIDVVAEIAGRLKYLEEE